MRSVSGMLASASRRRQPVPQAEQTVGNFDQPFPDLDGHPVTLARWPGKRSSISGATWCPPCLAEMPGFSACRNGARKFNLSASPPYGQQRQDHSQEKYLNYPGFHPPRFRRRHGTDGKLGNNRNAGMPFLVTFDASGRPRHLRLGPSGEAEAGTPDRPSTQP